MRKFLSIAAGLSFLAASSSFGTVWPSDGTGTGHNYLGGSVQWMHDNRAQNGDTITIPAGAFIWTNTVNITKAITLQGAGVGVTIVKDAGGLPHWTLAAGQLSRMTGIEFQDGGRVNTSEGALSVSGSNTNGSTFRWDHCKLNDVNVIPLIKNAIGVIDHCTFITFALHNVLYINNGNWNNQGQPDAGDGSWTAPVNWGSSAFTFVEDCEFIHNGTGLCAITDAYAGARFVVRHNTIFNGQVQSHGTESTGRARGVRAVEIYNNTFTATAGHGTTVGAMRSGNVLMHDNTATGYGATVMGLNNMRNIDGFAPWGSANGTNGFDVNDTTGGPNHDGIYFTGTAATASNCTGECTMAVTGANFTVNQWKHYQIKRLTNSCNFAGGNGWIEANTANTLTWRLGVFHNFQFCAGDTFEIRKVIQSLDQSGRGQGVLLGLTQSPTPPPGGMNQVIEPSYSWNNIKETGVHYNLSSSFGTIRAGEHYFNDTAKPGYTPFTYPHPLTKGLSLPQQTTSNATGNSQHNQPKERRPWGGKKRREKKQKKAKKKTDQ